MLIVSTLGFTVCFMVWASQPQFAVVGEAGDADEAHRHAAELQPDVILLTWLAVAGAGAAHA